MQCSELEAPEHAGAYDLVVCMEVLEHVIDPEAVLATLARLLAPSGRLVISVPVETGPALVVKQVVRRIAGWRGIGDYPGTTSYSLRDLAAGLFAGRTQHIQRPVHTATDGRRFHDHKGFNWRVVRTAIERRFQIERTMCSPVAWLPAELATQVWFVACKRQ